MQGGWYLSFPNIWGNCATKSIPCERRHSDDFSIRQYASKPLRKCIIWLLRELCSWSFMSHHKAFNCLGYLSVQILTAILLELPISVVEGTDLAGLEPAGDAVEMESMLAPRRQLLHCKEFMVLLRCRFPMLQCIPHWWQKLGLPGIRCLSSQSASSLDLGAGMTYTGP
jgi:hypothetical protein